MDAWQGDEAPPFLELHRLDDDWGLIEDTRAVTENRWQRVELAMLDALQAIREPTLEGKIDPVHRDQVEQLVERRLVVFYEERFMSLITEPVIGIRFMTERKKNLDRGRGRPSNPQVATERFGVGGYPDVFINDRE